MLLKKPPNYMPTLKFLNYFLTKRNASFISGLAHTAKIRSGKKKNPLFITLFFQTTCRIELSLQLKRTLSSENKLKVSGRS